MDPGWCVALGSSMIQGVAATAVLIDPVSFGATGDSEFLLSQLQQRGVATYLLRKNEDMAESLRNPQRFSTARHE